MAKARRSRSRPTRVSSVEWTKIIPAGGHYYDTDAAVCPEGPDNYIVDALDNMYVDCTNPDGCVTTCLRMTFY